MLMTLGNLLNNYTKEQLINIYKHNLELDIKVSQPKQELIVQIKTELLDSLEDILRSFPLGVLELLELGVNCKTKLKFSKEYRSAAEFLYTKGLAFISDENHYSYLLIAKELKEKLRDSMHDLIIHSEKQNEPIMNLTYGYVNLYGVIDIEMVYEHITRQFGYSIALQEYYELLDCFREYEPYIHISYDYISHHRVNNLYEILDHRMHEELTYREFSKKEVMEVAHKGGYIFIPILTSFKDYLIKGYRLRDEEVEQLLNEVILSIQVLDDVFTQLNIISQYLRISEYGQMKMMLEFLEELDYSLPKWVNYGYSLDDLLTTPGIKV